MFSQKLALIIALWRFEESKILETSKILYKKKLSAVQFDTILYKF